MTITSVRVIIEGDMKYDNVFHQFLEAMVERLGYYPNHFEHHVFVRHKDLIGFAYFDEGDWNWKVPAVYTRLALGEYTQIGELLVEACALYHADTNLPTIRPIPEIPNIRPFVAIQEAKNSEHFDELKWGVDEDGSDNPEI